MPRFVIENNLRYYNMHVYVLFNKQYDSCTVPLLLVKLNFTLIACMYDVLSIYAIELSPLTNSNIIG